MHLIEVDMVGAEPAQRVFQRASNPAPRITPHVRIVAHRAMHLAGEHDGVAPPLEGLANDFLGLSAVVAVSGVDEVDAEIQRLVDDADGVVVIGVADLAEHHGAQTVWADLDAGSAQRAILH